MFWLRTTFADFCKTKGIKLLKDDFRYIEECLQEIPQEAHKRVMKSFIEKWCECMGNEGKVECKQNLGRRNANLYLRELIE